MSLKSFHKFFITLATLLAFGVGYWGLTSYLEYGDDTLNLALGLISIGIGAGLIFYGVKVYQKLKSL